MARPRNKVKYISLLEAAKQTSYSQEYLSLRARQGKLKALKIGRNWVTTKSWLKEYIKTSNNLKDGLVEEDIGIVKFVAPPQNLPIEGFREKISIRELADSAFRALKLTGAFTLVLLFTMGVYSLNLPTKGEEFIFQVPDYVKNFSDGFDRGIRKLALDTHSVVQNFGKGFDTGLPTMIASLPGFVDQVNLAVQGFGESFSDGLAHPASVEVAAKDYGKWVVKQVTSLPRVYTGLNKKLEQGIARDVTTIVQKHNDVNGVVARGIRRSIQGLGNSISKIGQGTERGLFVLGETVGVFSSAVGEIKERVARKPVQVLPEQPPETEVQPQQVTREVQVPNGQELAFLKAQRLQLTDQRTGDIYCTWIDQGVLTTVRGECDTIIIIKTP